MRLSFFLPRLSLLLTTWLVLLATSAPERGEMNTNDLPWAEGTLVVTFIDPECQIETSQLRVGRPVEMDMDAGAPDAGMPDAGPIVSEPLTVTVEGESEPLSNLSGLHERCGGSFPCTVRLVVGPGPYQAEVYLEADQQGWCDEAELLEGAYAELRAEP